MVGGSPNPPKCFEWAREIVDYQCIDGGHRSIQQGVRVIQEKRLITDEGNMDDDIVIHVSYHINIHVSCHVIVSTLANRGGQQSMVRSIDLGKYLQQSLGIVGHRWDNSQSFYELVGN
jgi:hypothetical protein